jgi:hypothetical protein
MRGGQQLGDQGVPLDLAYHIAHGRGIDKQEERDEARAFSFPFLFPVAVNVAVVVVSVREMMCMPAALAMAAASHAREANARDETRPNSVVIVATMRIHFEIYYLPESKQ